MSHPQLSFSNTSFPSPTFLSRRRDVVNETTLLYQLEVLKSTGRYDAFKLKWHPSYDNKPDVPPVPNHLFWDSDVAKWIEGACYFLHSDNGGDITAAVKELVEMIRSAQQPDGYLNIHFTVVDPKGRFTNLRDMHELYNAGHLIEAALAHQDCFNNDLLMEPIVKYVDLLAKTFGPGKDQRHGYPGHPEIELALLRLYDRTRNTQHLDLAKYFLEERGNPKGQDGHHYYDVEAEERGEHQNERPAPWPENRSLWYMQAHEPIIDQKTIEGHSVRAMYLLTAVADLVRMDDKNDHESEKAALERLWNNMVDKKMYLTGGIGAMKQWEGFGIDYFLPSGTDEGGCYSETCAAIGVMMLAERLLQNDLDGRYGDIMELCFYNSVLTGMSASGREFTYVNQLASTETDLSQRAKWFTCACCPPNVTRLLGYIGGYIWSFTADEEASTAEINTHMYTSARLFVPVGEKVVEIEQTSNWPWDGRTKFEVQYGPNKSYVPTTIRLRIPNWAGSWKISPELTNPHIEKGYLVLPPEYIKENPAFKFDIPLTPRMIAPHPNTNQDIVALARGPIVYCLEDIDNAWVEDHFKSLRLDVDGRIEESTKEPQELLEPYVGLTMHDSAYFIDVQGTPAPGVPAGALVDRKREDVQKLEFVPYALRANRGGKGHMRVGIRKKH